MVTPCQLSEDQFLCSICHAVFTDPVTLPCGHNFCRKCIDQHWSVSDKCCCSYCKKLFFYRPELKVNIFIAKMANQFIQSQYKSTRSAKPPQAAKPDVALCDVCTGPKQRARKSCLVCLSLYCESHLKPHLNMCGLKKHQLMEPRKDIKNGVCAQGDKPGGQFCLSDQLCVCMDHKISLQKVSEQQRLLLQKTEIDIQDKINRRMTKIDELRLSARVSNDAADREVADGVKVFTALKEIVEKGLEFLISELTRKKTHTEQQAEGLVMELKQEISVLEKRKAEVKLQSESEDPLHLLLNSSQLSPDLPTKDWTDIDIGAQTHEGAVARALSELQHDFNQKTKSLFEAELKRVKSKEVDITLDSAAASSEINHSEEPSEIPDGANRCNGLLVFGKESYSESFYFEAEVKGKAEWTLGVAKEPIKRKGPLTLNPQNGFWSIGLKNKALCISDIPKMTGFTKFSPERVGVFVDYQEGIVSFYDVDASALIYSFTNFTFEDKLSPFSRITCGRPTHSQAISKHME